ncbi:hypothetical protein [Bacillus sp. NEB1478]|uniref:hypothetical protein n=1 Tax=Bacillus sp. NEB1478 TaxID=3073816 RepID=UPI00287309F1|nr:hypothetical protein [Bacillus sp. NEB1478]WNB91354.1 hypothetical protein RGB74_15830 [Bacillus sp. NEB1478]
MLEPQPLLHRVIKGEVAGGDGRMGQQHGEISWQKIGAPPIHTHDMHVIVQPHENMRKNTLFTYCM